MSEAFGKYQLIRPLAQGGMAELFLAQQLGPEGFRKKVVVKRALAHLSKRPEFTAMFLDEARLMARLSHPNIVQVFDFGQLEGAFYFAMEYLAGEDLAAVVQRSRNSGRVVPAQVAAVIATHVCEALSYVHALSDEQGTLLHVVHRDVSPSNVLITYQGTVKVLDFGIAKAEGKSSETQLGTLKGKFAYMSPEQARGEQLDGRSDLFSLGAVLYELLTGVRLFKREGHLAVLRAVTEEPIQPPRSSRPDIPEELDRIVLKALARDVSARYQTAAAMRDDLEQFLAARTYVPSAGLLQRFLADLFGEEHIRSQLQANELTPAAEHIDETAESPQLPLADRPTALRMLPEAPGTTGSAVELAPGNRWPLWGLVTVGVAAIAVTAFTLGRKASRSQPTLPAATLPTEPSEPSPPTLTAVEPPPAPILPTAQTAKVPPPETTPPPRPMDKRRPAGATHSALKTAPRSAAVGALAVNCAPWCHIYVDGRDTGLTSPASGIQLKPGRHRLRVVNPPTGKEQTRSISVPSGDQVVETVDFENQP